MSIPCSPMAGGSEVDCDSDSMDYGSQFLDLTEEGTPGSRPKWAAYLSDDDYIDFRPKISLLERIRLDEERENELIRKAKARGPARLPDNIVPELLHKPPAETAEEKAARYKAWCDKLDRIQREKEEMMEASRKAKRAEYEKYAKLQKEYYTRDYYWKPDPLFALHLRDMGYSKIAADKALFYTDNISVAKALVYLKENPNPTELTKEEVMAAGEEVLKRIRPVKPYRHNHTEETAREGEMEIEQASQPLLADDDCSTGIIADDSPAGIRLVPKEVPKEDPVDDPKNIDEMSEDKIRRGTKRNYDGEEVKSFPTTSTNVGHPLPAVKEIKAEYKMIFLVNAGLLMDAITLSLEVGKVVANITNKMRTGSDELRKMFDEWIKEGNKMSMYKGKNSDHLKTIYQSTIEVGLLSALGECSHYRDVKTPSSTVVGIFGDTNFLKILYNHLEMM